MHHAPPLSPGFDSLLAHSSAAPTVSPGSPPVATPFPIPFPAPFAAGFQAVPVGLQAVDLPGALDALAALQADAPACVVPGEAGQLHPVSIGKMARRSQRMAARLYGEYGVRMGDCVAYLGYNRVDQLVLLFALARLGALLVPLNTRLAEPEWQGLLVHAGVGLVVHDTDWADAARAWVDRSADQTPRQTVALEALVAQHCSTQPPPVAGLAGAPVLLVYTSGSTGVPKAAVHTQKQLLANARKAVAVQGLTARDRVLAVLPLFHVGGLCIQALPALLTGAVVYLPARFDAGAWLDAVAQWRPTLALHVPATLKAVQQHPAWLATDLSCLRAVWAGSSLIDARWIAPFHARGVPVCNVYGATETGPVSIALPLEQAMARVGACGWPAPGVEVRLVPVNASPVAANDLGRSDVADVGEVWLRADNVVDHYWPAQPARDAQGWFHTGDLARVDAQGCYTVVGRCKDLIISGGENMYPAEIEQWLNALPAVVECSVLGVPDEQWGEVPVAVVVLRPGQVLESDAMVRELAKHLARYKLPRRIEQVDVLPKTALGKVQKHVLLSIFS
jgi:fatty-acyl-CoA synthase